MTQTLTKLFLAICVATISIITVKAQSPTLVRDIRTGSNSSGPYGLTVIGSTIFMAANNGFNGTELYKTDGTSGGTVIVKDINTTSGTSSSCQFFVNLNGTLIFVADNGTNGFEIWKSDGTFAGTALVTDINPGSNDANPTSLTVVGNYVYFSATNGTDGIELWRTDGTAAGTQMVKDLWAGSGNGSPAYLVNVNGTLFFQANDGFNGVELWKSDGTIAGTTIVKDIYLGFNSSNPNALTNINGTLYFTAETANQGGELWKSNGTSSGTVLVKDINTGTAASNPSGYTLVGSNIFFSAYTPNDGYELWKTDGTSAGTSQVKDINNGPNGSSLTSPLVVNGQLYFSANDGAFGNELWTSNGTSSGTFMLSDINPGSASSNPTAMAQYSNVLYFRATTATTGAEMYRSDGTASGTILISDMALGTISSDAGGFVNMNGTLYFPANDGVVGRELFKYTPPPCIPPNANLVVTDATACAGQGNTVNISINNTESATYYQPFYGQTPVGASIAGVVGQNISLTMLCNALAYDANDIIIKVTKNGCPATQLNDTAIVTITGTQDQNVNVTGGVVCSGSGAYVQLGATQSGVAYQAKINGTLVGLAVTSLGGDTSLFIPSASLSLGANEVYVNASGTQNCPDVELLDSALVFVSGTPSNASTTGAIVCGSGAATLTASGAQNNQTYNWYTTASGGSPIAGATTASYTTPTLSTTTTYYVSLVKQNGCESTTRTTVTATISALPQVLPIATAASNLNICGSGNTTIFLQDATANETYRWYSVASGGAAIAGTSGNSYTIPSISASSIYYPCLVNADGCEGSRSAITVNVETLPSAPTAIGANICGSGQGNLTASGAAINNTYQWYTSATGNNAISGATNATFTTPTISTTTIYYVGTVSANACISATRTAAVATIIALPVNATGTSNARCGAGPVTLTAQGAPFGNTYQWYTSASGNTAISNAVNATYTTPSISSTTNYYVTIINTDNCESANRTLVTATINAIPADASVTGASRCGTGSVTLSANGGQTYKWYTSQTSAAISGANGASFTTPSLSTTTNYFVTIVGVSNCESANRISVTATINEIPAAPATAASGSVCGSGTVTLTASPINVGESYQWYTSSTGNTAITGETNASYTSPSIANTTTFYVATISAAGCESTNRTAAIATVNALPIAPTTSNDSVCGSGTITLTANSAINNGTYQWYSSAIGNTPINGAISASYTTPNISATTNYYVSVISSVGCESDNRAMATAIINVIPAAPTTIGASACGQGALNLSAAGAASNASYIWHTAATGNNSISGITGDSYTTPILSNTTSYYVSITSGDACESTGRTLVIATINVLPTAPTVTSVSRCGNGTVSLQAAGSNVYAWYTSATATTAITGETSNNYVTPYLTQSTNYYVASVSAEGCESANRSIASATLNALPNVPTITAGGSLTFCNGDSISLTANTNVSIQSWSNGSNNAQIVVSQSGNYTVTVVDANFCSSTSLPTSVLVNPKPITPIVTANGATTVCDGNTVTLTTPTATTYVWSNGTTTQSNNITTSGTFTVHITNQFGCVSEESQGIAVAINPLPATPVISASSTIICASNPIMLDAPNDFSSYLWSNNQTTQSISTTVSGDYTVIVTDANGCSSLPSASIAVTNIPSPTAPIITALSNAICGGDSIVLNASSGFASYAWSNGETTSSITVSSQATYTVTGYFCSGSNNLISLPYSLTVYNVAPASITGNSNICPNSSTTLIASNGDSYLWTIPTASNINTQSINATEAGEYAVLVTDANGCTSTATQTINEYIVALATIIGNAPTSLCPGTTVLVNANTANSYSWSNGAITQATSITNTGCYTVTTTDANGCTSISSPFCLNYLAGVPTPNIVSTDSALCFGETSVVSCSTCPVGGVNYLWSNSLNTPTQTLSSSACLTLTISDINGCAATSNSYCVASLPTPANPTLSFDNTTGILTASATADNYTWFVDGATSAFNTQSILPTNNGLYSVIATNNNGCISDTSAGFNYLFTGISMQDVQSGFNMYPNPATDFITLEIKNTNNVFVQIYDATGKDVYLNQITNQNNSIRDNLDLSNLSEGIYYAKVTYNGKVKALKFLKTK